MGLGFQPRYLDALYLQIVQSERSWPNCARGAGVRDWR